jgi:hypothetical protein
VAALALGFTVSAFAVTGLAHLAGAGAFGWWHPGAGLRLAVAGVVLLACALLDSGKLGFGTPMWRRQTPRRLFIMFGPAKGALLWGLDTGLMVTTFRVTSLTWATLALAVLGLLPWWAGVAYAAGFVIPIAVLVLLVPARHNPGRAAEAHWVMDVITTAGRRVARVSPFLFAMVAAACLAASAA